MVVPCLFNVKMDSWVLMKITKNIEELEYLFAAHADIVLAVLYFATLFAVFLHPTFV